MVGLSNVDNMSDINKVFNESQITNLVTDLESKASITYVNNSISSLVPVSTNLLNTDEVIKPANLIYLLNRTNQPNWTTTVVGTIFTGVNINSLPAQSINFNNATDTLSIIIPDTNYTNQVCTL